MNRQSSSGFTLVEVMLVLAVTGLMVLGILVGTGVSIANQRYRDSVYTVQSVIQEEYNQVINTLNSRTTDADIECYLTGQRPTELAPRGRSECVLLGRYITIAGNGEIVARSVITRYNELHDSQPLGGVQLWLSSSETTSRVVPWGATIRDAASTNANTASILIVRSPLTNGVMTFTATGANPVADSEITTLVTPENRQARVLCVESEDWFVGGQLAVRIQANASGPAGIEVPEEQEGVCS